jgi:hypothetical protein
MPEQEAPRDPAPQYGETKRPENPPNSVLQPAARRSAVRTYVGGIVALFLIVGAVLIYQAARDSAPEGDPNRGEPASIGTAGGARAAEPTPGGVDPAPRPDSTRDELEFRGAGEPPQGPMPPLGRPLNELGSAFEDQAESIGRRIELSDVEVERVEADGTFWVKDGNARAHVLGPRDGDSVRSGDRVDVRGTVEADDRGGIRIRAAETNVR